MEEHLWAEEALISDIDVDHVSINCLVNKSLKLIRLHNLAINVLLLIILGILFQRIFAHITILLFNFWGDFRCISSRKLLSTVSKLFKSELSDISSSKRNMLNARWDNKTITHREDVSDSISWVNDCSCHGTKVEVWKVCTSRILILSSNLSIQCESSLHSNEESLNIEGLKHDLCHLLSILWSVHGWLCQNESMVVWFTSNILVNRLVPELLNTIPVANLTTLE